MLEGLGIPSVDVIPTPQARSVKLLDMVTERTLFQYQCVSLCENKHGISYISLIICLLFIMYVIVRPLILLEGLHVMTGDPRETLTRKRVNLL